MVRIYYPYWLWEDYKNGMYESVVDDIHIVNSKTILCNPELFMETCLLVINNWVVSSENNLTNIYRNRRAWLGQAACCYLYQSSRLSTKIAWSLMTDSERLLANNVAQIIINNFEVEIERKNIELYI